MDRASALAACVAQALHLEPAQVPVPAEPDPVARLGEWLAGRNLGLVPVADPERFSWPGYWVALVGDPWRPVLMFGVPSGPVLDPLGGTEGPIVRGLVPAPADTRALAGLQRAPRLSGTVEAIVVAEAAEATCRLVESAVVGATGLDGDRYAAGAGTFSAPGTSGRHVTLVEAEALESAGVAFTAARRNVVTRGVDLDALIGQEFALGSARLVGRRRCEPCAHLERLEGPGLLRPLVHRGGLRADVVATGSVSVGDAVGSS
jgi:hypothetical protein